MRSQNGNARVSLWVPEPPPQAVQVHPQVQLYRARQSGPLLDRIDMHVEVPAVTARELMRGMGRRREQNPTDQTEVLCAEERSAVTSARVEAAREVQRRRFAALARHGGDNGERIHCNAQMGLQEIEEHCLVDQITRAFLQKAIESLSLSAREAHRSLRVARTIADLAGAREMALDHVAETVRSQALDRIARGH